MASSRTIIVAGAGIGGLTAALALARKGFRVVIFEQAPELSATGAGIQLSPNATRLLIELGIGESLRPSIVVPEHLSIHRASNGRELARMTIGSAMEQRYGAPYWIVHRGDLQAALLAAVSAHPDIVLNLGAVVQDVTHRADGVTAQVRRGDIVSDEYATALIGADGLWSKTRRTLDAAPPRFSGRAAWRATVPTSAMPQSFRESAVHLWLGRNAHLVHYPVRTGDVTNIVAIVRDRWQGEGWSSPGTPDELFRHFGAGAWGDAARSVLQRPDAWLKWALFDRAPSRLWGKGAMTLLGDAAHPMLPFLAQGGAMAIEDAMVLADCLGQTEDIPAALRTYENLRQPRTRRVQDAARFTGSIYQMSGPFAFARNAIISGTGSDALRNRYDWIYSWRR